MIPFPFDPPTGWVPTAYVGEDSPPYRETPDGWIARVFAPSHGVYLASATDDATVGAFITSAEIVKFSAFFDLGRVEITVRPDGSWTSAMPAPAAATNFCVVGEPDCHEQTMDALARAWAGMPSVTEADVLDVQCWLWIDNVRYILGRQPHQPFTFIPVQTVGRRVSEAADR